ncbi:LLM class F420-dependent oxidoreductase [Dictyobacter vulcani]|uniref:LLM class F420-dependent oxidoreductase n=1 Tax=Dictyobacter vulcani TaxID=2607529 RepID=A0A5J4KXZ1_9CHLR|nr:LLM class flavin-dependent oxidoreductase [Dictyobacter vulcani]GER91381.1 LLM class F420-dependent oxidoreductase [Dictyobacter vulcani]
MAHIQFGLALPSRPLDGMTRRGFLEQTRKNLDAVVESFDSIWFIDHVQFKDSQLLEGWTALTHMAALYPTFQFGHVVLCQSFRNPALLAKMAATAQFMSEGRFILGIGAGWHQEEYDAYGYKFPPAGTRVEELDETLQIVKALWTEPRATIEGKHYQVRDAYCEPKPEPLPPIMVGASQPRMLRLTARYGDWWNVSQVDIESYRKLVTESEKACQVVGRDPATLRRTWFGGCLCVPEGTDPASIDMKQVRSPNPFVGTPSQIIEQMKPFVDLGVDYFMLKNEGFPDSTSLRLLSEEVLPRLNS